MKNFESILSGGDLRSIGKSNEIVSLINNQESFDQLFNLLFNKDRKIVMRASDAIEKITQQNPYYLLSHKKEILKLLKSATDKELKWHLALLVTRFDLNGQETSDAFKTLSIWATDKDESKIVRVNSLQAITEISVKNKKLITEVETIMNNVANENIKSINARIKKLRKLLR